MALSGGQAGMAPAAFASPEVRAVFDDKAEAGVTRGLLGVGSGEGQGLGRHGCLGSPAPVSVRKVCRGGGK